METSDELIQRGADLRRAIATLAARDDDDGARAAALEAVEVVEQLRRIGATTPALEAAEQTLARVTELTRRDVVAHLPALTRATEALARCCQAAGLYPQAAASYAQAVEARRILTASAPSAAGILELLELSSSHALALAQSGELERAHTIAVDFVARARDHLPHSLPLLVGGLAFLADLAADLDRPDEAVGHLIDGLRMLRPAIEQDLPGAREAGQRVAARLRDAVDGREGELPEDVAELVRDVNGAPC